jgi:hypothetical protein
VGHWTPMRSTTALGRAGATRYAATQPQLAEWPNSRLVPGSKSAKPRRQKDNRRSSRLVVVAASTLCSAKRACTPERAHWRAREPGLGQRRRRGSASRRGQARAGSSREPPWGLAAAAGYEASSAARTKAPIWSGAPARRTASTSARARLGPKPRLRSADSACWARSMAAGLRGWP